MKFFENTPCIVQHTSVLTTTTIYLKESGTIKPILLIDPRVQHRMISRQRFAIQITTKCRSFRYFTWCLRTRCGWIGACWRTERRILVLLLYTSLDITRWSWCRIERGMGTSRIRRNPVRVGGHARVVIWEGGRYIGCTLIILVEVGFCVDKSFFRVSYVIVGNISTIVFLLQLGGGCCVAVIRLLATIIVNSN